MDEIIRKIASTSGLTEEDVHSRIEDKQAELSGLISYEGATYMVARELGVELRKTERLLIENIIPGMQNVDIVGKIMRIDRKDYESEKGKGKLAAVTLADESGSIRLVLWNEEIEKLSAEEGDTVRVRGFVREGLYGNEIRLGRYGNIVKSEEEIKVETAQKKYDRSAIAQLRENQYKELRASLLQVFEGNAFYEICPKCSARVKEENNFRCEEHGEVEPDHALVVSGIVDDGTGNLRAVFFGENAEKILNYRTDEARKAFMRKMDRAAVFERVQLGKEFLFEGAVRRNKVFDRLEFVVNNVKNVDVKKEIESLLQMMG
ncbi:MAG: DUF2240 family protein [Candidatus Aenigmarchaeota archaeon]|nr:DUF2240 family protein [Candidatus Aenigmarchaeota archaeon]